MRRMIGALQLAVGTGALMVLGEDRSFGFDLGHNTSFVATITEIFERSELIERANSEILLSCYPDLKLPLPTSIKLLISQKFSDLKLQSPNYLLGTEVFEGPDGFPIFRDKNNMLISLSEFLSNSLSFLYELPYIRKSAERTGCGIGIPVYFTDSQRSIVLHAARKAGLDNPVLIHETTASALSHANVYYEEADSSEVEKIYLIVDMGATSMQVSLAKYTDGKVKVLSHAFDYSLGGRAFDEVLLNHFVDEFEEFGFDATKNADLYWKLYSACEQMKIELSSRKEASFKFGWDDQELIGSMKRTEFERMCAPLLERVKRPLEKALSDSGLRVENINSVENVGLASQIPAIIKILTDFFGRQPNQVTEEKTHVVEGCAKLVDDLEQAEDIFPHSIAMSWNAKKVKIEGCAILFPNGTPMNTVKEISFATSAPFSVGFMYANISDRKIATRIGRFKIGPFQSSKCKKVSGKFSVKLDRNGIISVESASISKNGIEVQLDVSRLNQLQEQHEDMLEAERLSQETNEDHTNEMELLSISKQSSEMSYVFYDCEG